MARIIQPGNKPAPPPSQPWWLMGRLNCPKCYAIFTLEPSDFDGSNAGDHRPWIAHAERMPNGKQSINGLCPHCQAHITISRDGGR